MRQAAKDGKRSAARRIRIDAGVTECFNRGTNAADCAHVLRLPEATVNVQYGALLQQRRDRRVIGGGTNYPSGLLHCEAATVALATATIAEHALAEFHPVPADPDARRIARRNNR